MEEIYWITRFDAIHATFIIFLIISTIASVITAIGYTVNKCEEIEYPGQEEAPKYKKLFHGYFKYSVVVFVISLVGLIFIPTTKQAFLIYGIGGTVDYLKTNPTARQLPDKCIKAIDKWISIEEADSLKNQNKK